MSDEGQTGRASATPVEGGSVIKFTGPDDETSGATAPRGVISDNTFVIGDPEGSAIMRFLANGHLYPHRLPRGPILC